jgi:hypothetical protein
MKQSNVVIILVVGIVLIVVLGNQFSNMFAIGTSGTVTRTTPTTVQPGQQFTVTYTTQPPTTKYLAAVEDTISGGCTPATKKILFISDDGTTQTQTATFTAPQTGSCTFAGNYQYSGWDQIPLPSSSVSVIVCTNDCSASGGTQCTSSGAYKTCGNYDTDTCLEWSTTNTNCNVGYQCLSSTNNCVQCKTEADADCNNAITTAELITYGSKWLNGQITTAKLIEAGNAWLGA